MLTFRKLSTALLIVTLIFEVMGNAQSKMSREKKKRNKEDLPLTIIPSSGLNADTSYLPVKGFEGAVLAAKSGYVLPYRYKIMTQEKTTIEKYPLFVVFHGVGRIGSDNKRQISMGNALVKKLTQLEVNAIVVQPQTAAGWAQKMVDGSKPILSSVVELIDHFVTNHSVDSDRIYVLGNSVGCGGVWNILLDYPEYIAAAVPVVGGAPHEKAEELADVPLWMFSAQKDVKSRADSCREMLSSLKKMKRTNVKHTHYNDLSHANTFSSMFDRDKVVTWLLEQKRVKKK